VGRLLIGKFDDPISARQASHASHFPPIALFAVYVAARLISETHNLKIIDGNGPFDAFRNGIEILNSCRCVVHFNAFPDPKSIRGHYKRVFLDRGPRERFSPRGVVGIAQVTGDCEELISIGKTLTFSPLLNLLRRSLCNLRNVSP